MLKDYIIELDEIAKCLVDKEVFDKGIDNYLNQKLFYLDATRELSDGLRPEQTISFVYRYDVSSYLYAITKYVKEETDEWMDKLTERHEANLAYEEVNPPVVYDIKTHKSVRKSKPKQTVLPGFDEPKRAGLKLSLKIVKPNDTV